MEGAVPVSLGAHAVLHRRSRQRPLPLFRLRSRRRRHPLRAADRPAGFPGGGRGPGFAVRRHDPAAGAARAPSGAPGPALRGRRGGPAVLRRAALAPGQPRGQVPREPPRPRRALEDAGPGTRRRRLGPSLQGADRAYPESCWSRRGSSSHAPKARAITIGSATGCSSSCATSAGGRSALAAARCAGGRAEVPQLAGVAGLPQEALALRPFEAREAIRKHDRVVLVEG